MSEREKALEAALLRWQSYGCPDCSGDCGSANPPVFCCIMQETRAALALRATVDRASWTPPEDRPDGYVCLGLVPVTWHGEVMGWRDSGMEQVDPLGFAPPPEDKP